MYSKTTLMRPRLLYPSGESFDDPFGWTDVCETGTDPVLIELEFDYESYAGGQSYYAVKLLKGIEYTFRGVHSTGGTNASFHLYNDKGDKVAYNTGNWDDNWENYIMEDLVYTPTADGDYVFAIMSGGEPGMGGGDGAYSVTVSPRPLDLNKSGPTPYETSTGLATTGGRDFKRVASETGLTPFDLWLLFGFFKDFADAWARFLEWLKNWHWGWYWQLSKTVIFAPLTDPTERPEKDLVGATLQWGGTKPGGIDDYDYPLPVNIAGDTAYGVSLPVSIYPSRSFEQRAWYINFYWFVSWPIDADTGNPVSGTEIRILNYFLRFHYANIGPNPKHKYLFFASADPVIVNNWSNNTWRDIRVSRRGDVVTCNISPLGDGTGGCDITTSYVQEYFAHHTPVELNPTTGSYTRVCGVRAVVYNTLEWAGV